MNILKKATLMLCCAAFAGAAEALAQEAIGQTHILIAHRGGKYEVDENTIDGFSKAYAAGVRAYETDFRMTKDGVVVINDATLKRMFNVDKTVESMTIAEVRELKTAKGNPLPTAEEFFDHLADKDYMYVECEMKTDSKEAYYDEAGFYDYIHKLSRTPILKAQHPDYEIAQMGIHGQRGVSCADCHMPYKSEGGVKFSDHHIQSPLAMIDRTCQVCHRESEETLRNNVYERQRKANEIRNRLEQELAKAHIEAKFAWDNGATEAQMKDVLALIRQAQWRWDFGVASHGGSFHAPQEIQRILSHGLDRAMQARLAVSKVLAKNGYTGDVPMPDISTKAKAQEYIGLDMAGKVEAKEQFLQTIVPQWIAKAKEQGKLLDY